MKVAFNIQYGKRHLSYRGLLCATEQGNLLEGHEMLRMASELALRLEELGHLAFVLSYGSMRRRANWVNGVGMGLAVGLTLTKGFPAVLWANKFDPEGQKAQLICNFLNSAGIFADPSIRYKALPLKRRSARLALISMFDPQKVRDAFVIAPYSCSTKPYFLPHIFFDVFLKLIDSYFELVVPSAERKDKIDLEKEQKQEELEVK